MLTNLSTCLTGLVWLVITSHCFAESANNHYTAVSDILFPETMAWTAVDSTDTVSHTELLRIRKSLAHAYHAALSTQQLSYEKECSFIEKALNTPETSFHKLDINHDGMIDIVYVGKAQCVEGDATVIWYGNGTNYTVPPSPPIAMRLLRLSAVDDKIVSVSAGCCDDRIDTYYLGTIDALWQNALPILRETKLPTTPLAQPISFISRAKLKLRVNPKIDDKYNADLSQYLGNAGFGNVLREYLPNSKGIVLARKEVGNHNWLFVKMAEQSNALVVYDPYRRVRAGWIQEHDVEFIESESPRVYEREKLLRK